MMRRVALSLAVALIVAGGPAAAGGQATAVFQADTVEDFDYSEGFKTFNGGLECLATSDNGDYLGERLPAAQIYDVTFRIEAAHDGLSSTFEVDLSLVDKVPSSSTKQQARDDSLRARFVESGNDWAVALIQESGGATTTLEQAYFGDPNQYTAYTFRADLQRRQVALLDADGIVVMESVIVAKDDDRIFSQWYRCSGSNGVNPANMMLDNYGATHRSTQVRQIAPDEPPVIGDITQTPVVVEAGQTVRVAAPVTDDEGLADVVLRHRVGLSVWSSTAMTGSPFSAEIPGQPNGAEVSFYIRATDTFGHVVDSEVIKYVVGSGQGAQNTGQKPDDGGGPGGGGTLTGRLSSASAGPIVFLAVGLGVAFLLRYIGAEKRVAIMVALGGVVLAAGSYIYGAHSEAIQEVPNLVWVLAGGAAAIGFLQRRRARRSLL